jgi:hypothetical protein
MDNPYRQPNTRIRVSGKGSSPRGGALKYIVATVGALLVTFGAFVAIMLAPTVLFPTVYESKAGLVVLYMIGIVLALSAGVGSFRSTLRVYSRK